MDGEAVTANFDKAAGLRERVLVTGPTGFVGRHLLYALQARGYRVRAAVRSPTAALPAWAERVVTGDLRGEVNWETALEGIDAIVHLAGIAHATGLPADLYDTVNHRATGNLGRAAVRAGVRRFVFVSSVLAQTGPNAAADLTEDDVPRPAGPYGASKRAAELTLASLALEWVALRPVLVYGAGVRGNMAQLVRLAGLSFPLPFGAVANRRSLLAVEDLSSAILFTLGSPDAVRKTFLVADDDPLSLPQMIAALRAGFGRRPGLVALPPAVLHAGARLVGRHDAWQRAAGTLVVSNQKLCALGWAPRIQTRMGLASLASQTREARDIGREPR